MVFPLIYHEENGSSSFAGTFHDRFGCSPDYMAAYSYDSVCLLIDAIQKAGLNRARICDAVKSLAPWQGVTGKIDWDGLGSNTMAVRLGRIESGRVEPLPRPEPQ
ncbi:MAG: hypothetical protein QGH15_11880 [Kiritimatiellia bacterium]|jgi:ABC-type branched-subunit amino acid transport system substrate-binding protein|nr:hypothetical protein [Kiritimatiellia bacterium]